MERINFSLLRNKAEKEIKRATDLEELNVIFKKYLGKKGIITQILSSLKNLPKEKRSKIGRQANLLKSIIEKEKEKREIAIKKQIEQESEKDESIDVTLPAKRPETGHLHPLTLVRRKVEKIFESMGFCVVQGPHIETEWYNFDALSIPKDHPARDLWDTFWLDQKRNKEKLLLRTHTSPVQVRYMEKHNPPFRIIVPGRVFRHEASDASHDIQFYQVEGLMIDTDISVTNFKGIIDQFLRKFFNRKIKTRLRPGYFPFVEPGFEIDVQCFICQGKGCSTCSQTGWVELCPGGMVHPNVLKAGGLNPKNWQGFAFGMGLDRLAMMTYKIGDIRLFYNGDLRFLKQF